MNLPYNYKQTLANFRCSSHDLKIETGRHLNIDRDFRFCSLYLRRNVYVVENEVHFLIDCPVYNELREGYLNYNEWNSIVNSDERF